MAIDSSNYHIHTADWRQSLKSNQRHTVFVIVSFIVIYLLIGLLFDLYMYSEHHPHVPLSIIFTKLVTLQLIPLATIIAGVIAMIAIFVTFFFSDKLMLLGSRYHEVLPESTTDIKEKQLYNVVEEMKVAAGLNYMPKIYVIDANYMNAFASGYSEKSAMVAMTRGLLEKLDRDEMTAVMAHELSHIRHMDIKLTLMASVLSNFTLILIDILFWSSMSGANRGSFKKNNRLFIVILVMRYVLPLITVCLMLYLSRVREYMADAGCVELMRNNEPLARALLKIQDDHAQNKAAYAAEYTATPHESIRRQAYIFDPVIAGIETKKSISDMFSTHPNIAQRLAAIGIKSKT